MKKSDYLYFAWGTLGLASIYFCFVKLFFLAISNIWDVWIMLGFGLVGTVHYIYHLEKKIGISSKLIWIRIIIIVFILAIYYLYFIR